jgi:hypothetical protein
VGSGSGTRVAASATPVVRASVAHAAHAGTAAGLNDVLLAAAGLAALGAIVAFAFGAGGALQRSRNRRSAQSLDSGTVVSKRTNAVVMRGVRDAALMPARSVSEHRDEGKAVDD